MNLENIKNAVGVYVAACRGVLHDDALAFVQAVEAHIKALEAPKPVAPAPKRVEKV